MGAAVHSAPGYGRATLARACARDRAKRGWGYHLNCAPAPSLSENFGERIPVMLLPSGGQMLSIAFRKSGVVEHNFRHSRLLRKLKPSDRVHTSWPTEYAPCLNNKLIGHEFELTAYNVSVKQGERSTHLRTQLRWVLHLGIGVGLHDAA